MPSSKINVHARIIELMSQICLAYRPSATEPQCAPRRIGSPEVQEDLLWRILLCRHNFGVPRVAHYVFYGSEDTQ